MANIPKSLASVGRAKNAENAEVAQLVEHIPEEDGVASSSLALGTRNKYD